MSVIEQPDTLTEQQFGAIVRTLENEIANEARCSVITHLVLIRLVHRNPSAVEAFINRLSSLSPKNSQFVLWNVLETELEIKGEEVE